MSTVEAAKSLTRIKTADHELFRAQAQERIATLEAQLRDVRSEREALKQQVEEQAISIKAKDASIQKMLAELYDKEQAREKEKKKKRAAARRKRQASRARKPRRSMVKNPPNINKKHDKERTKWEDQQKVAQQFLDQTKSTPEIEVEPEGDEDVIDLELVASHFPSLPISFVLECERKFVEADADGSGLIDKEELQKVIDQRSISMGAVTAVINEANLDTEHGLDFLDCLLIYSELAKIENSSSSSSSGGDYATITVPTPGTPSHTGDKGSLTPSPPSTTAGTQRNSIGSMPRPDDNEPRSSIVAQHRVSRVRARPHNGTMKEKPELQHQVSKTCAIQ